MEPEKIKNLDELIKKYHGENVQIVDKKMTNLTAPGENYLSDIFKLDVTIKNKNGNESIEHYVAKSVLIKPDMSSDMNVEIFKNEILFYTTVIPTIRQFAKEHGLQDKDVFPELIAARMNLDHTDKTDENAVLILENLAEKGYKNADRHISFDLDGAKLILSDLAIFHAIPLAMKIQKPKLFEENIAKICKLPTPPNKRGEMNPSSPPNPLQGGDKDDKMKPPNLVPLLTEVAKEDIFCRNHVDKLEKFIIDMEKKMIEEFGAKTDPSLPFATLCHNDMWVNNTMQRSEQGKFVKNKFVDFQMCSVSELFSDLIFFLFSSVDLITLENHFDYLIMFYHECFIKILEKCKCDVAPYAYNKFMMKIKDAIPSKFLHIMVMNFFIIYAKKGVMGGPFRMKELTSSETHAIAKKKFLFLFRKLIENDWI
ncbi:uncharacterized protein LOC130453246 [Diorhabda sublineata]|uniref:uncharacterized protein LOC130453246 n=1 Tax=Diorhabda sublineata TaxID=1163346 RepID=UPI0024E15A70|nr:uncharacterized protein LOC130453246 [Diorhabda sublineata]